MELNEFLLEEMEGDGNMNTVQNDFEKLLKDGKELTQEEIDRIIKEEEIKSINSNIEEEAEDIDWKNRYIKKLYKQQHVNYYYDFFENYYTEDYYADDDTYSNY